MDLNEALRETRQIAGRLRGQTIGTVAQGRPNTIVDVTDQGVVVRARTKKLVTWDQIDSVVKYLHRRREATGADLKKDNVLGAYRGAFISALLGRCSFADASIVDGIRTLRWID
ncbi:MAG: hypothetical protein IIC90_10560 [Chloroflexi bacterium]|nr:hypothetical protein [Chloroflexota bacterium]